MTDKSPDIMFLYNIIDIWKKKMHTVFVMWIVCLSRYLIAVCEWSFNKRGEMSRRTVACQGLLECPRLQAMNITNIGRFTRLQWLIVYTSRFIFSKKKNTWFRHAWHARANRNDSSQICISWKSKCTYSLYRYNLNSISWFCILTIYFNTLVICIMINIFFPAESPPAPTLAIYGTHGTTIE